MSLSKRKHFHYPTNCSWPTGDDTVVRRDKHVLGHFKTLYEPGVNLDRLRRERLEKVQREMAARDIGALVLMDTNNIRYTTGISVMPIWTALNLTHDVLIPVEGSPIIFEFPDSAHRAEPFFDDVREATFWQARFTSNTSPQRSTASAPTTCLPLCRCRIPVFSQCRKGSSRRTWWLPWRSTRTKWARRTE